MRAATLRAEREIHRNLDTNRARFRSQSRLDRPLCLGPFVVKIPGICLVSAFSLFLCTPLFPPLPPVKRIGIGWRKSADSGSTLEKSNRLSRRKNRNAERYGWDEIARIEGHDRLQIGSQRCSDKRKVLGVGPVRGGHRSCFDHYRGSAELEKDRRPLGGFEIRDQRALVHPAAAHMRTLPATRSTWASSIPR